MTGMRTEDGAGMKVNTAAAVNNALELGSDSGRLGAGLANRLNWLRAGVMGANDGILATAAVVVGVAGATTATGPVISAGFAALFGGATAMGLGEFVSVSAQRDSQRAAAGRQAEGAANAVDSIANDDGEFVSPWHATVASASSFLAGGVWPMAAAVVLPAAWRIPAIFIVAMLALGAVGYVAARVGGASGWRATARMLVGGLLAMTLTYLIGILVGEAAFG